MSCQADPRAVDRLRTALDRDFHGGAVAAAGGAQTAGVITGIKVLCVLLPAIFSLGSWAAFKFVWNITPETREKVSAFHAAKKTAK
mgnify:CR=1 FL=1